MPTKRPKILLVIPSGNKIITIIMSNNENYTTLFLKETVLQNLGRRLSKF